jgi:hypothetical protein
MALAGFAQSFLCTNGKLPLKTIAFILDDFLQHRAFSSKEALLATVCRCGPLGPEIQTDTMFGAKRRKREKDESARLYFLFPYLARM